MHTIKLPIAEEIKVQNSLDFYLSITSVKSKSLKEVRTSLYSKFMLEYKEDNYPLIDLNKYRKPIKKEKDITKVDNSFLQTLQKKMENSCNPNKLEDDFPIEDEDKVVFNNSNEDINFENSTEDFNVTEDSFEENTFEELVQKDHESLLSESINNIDTEDSIYVSHGIYLEDLIDGSYIVSDYDDILEDNEEDINDEVVENTEESSSEDIDENLDFSEEDESEEFSSEDIDENLDFSEEDESEEFFSSGGEESDEVIEELSSEIVEQGEVEYSDEEWFLNNEKSSTSISQPIQKEVSIEDDGKASEDVPSDVRAFLKHHPGSEILYVLKFYSKKDIDKALMLGRIYKKNGKLFI